MIADTNNGNYGNNENNGVAFYEFGPGDVLKGMIRKINPEVQLG